jgi:hypothetical protein
LMGCLKTYLIFNKWTHAMIEPVSACVAECGHVLLSWKTTGMATTMATTRVM